MAVSVPTTTRVCLKCKINSDANAEKEFHEIFDEVGLELQLPFLVKKFFYIYLNKRDNQHLCDDCVNRLIELYDLDEHVKEESSNTNNLKNKQECSNNQESSKYFKNESGNFRYERENVAIDQNNTQVTLSKSNYIECTNFETFVSTQGETALEIHKENRSEDKDRTEYENNEDLGYFFNRSRSARFTLQQNQSINGIAEDFDQTGERKDVQDFINDEKSDEMESSENMEFISDDENQNVEMNKQSNANIIVGSKKLEIEEYQIKSNEKIEVLSETKSETKEIIFLESDQDEFVEENVSEEFINSGDSNSLLEELQITEENQDLLPNTSRSETEFNDIEHIDADYFIEQNDISDGTYSLEEEYLIEETILSEEYDQVYLNEYLDEVLVTKFQDLLLNWEMECKLCRLSYSFKELLNHACMAELEKEQQLSCIIKDCEEHARDLPTLARHLVLKHYDKLESARICGECTVCKKTFSNVLDLNKHSCCRNIKRITGALNYCKYCDLYFQSFKRYVFHMQFHLKNHRPKICLLCSDLFNNSKDFFEHTHYKHYPKTAFACLRCDLYFKDLQVLNSHMKKHEDSKYPYECELCPKKYSSNIDLHQHMDTCHNIKSYLQCEYCPKKYAYKISYFKHIKTHHTEAKVQTFICSTCGLITNSMEIIKEHIESDNESPCFSSPVDQKILGLGYSCENCSLDFYTIKHLKDHRLSDSHSDDLFHCDKCGKSFSNYRFMRIHSFNCKGYKELQESFPITKYFVCNIGDCQEFYTNWKSLYSHKCRPHNTEEKTNSPTEFKCQFCQQLCSSKFDLSVHLAKFHNANFKCYHCKRNFKFQNILKKHYDKFHTPVECDICLKKFKPGRNLERHIDCVHNNAKHYFCKHCQKGYFQKNQRNMHEQKVHPQL